VVNPFVANELRSVSLLPYGEESLAKKLFGWGIESHETQRGKRKYLPKRPARSTLTLKHADILDSSKKIQKSVESNS
jgi:hypothetical protein